MIWLESRATPASTPAGKPALDERREFLAHTVDEVEGVGALFLAHGKDDRVAAVVTAHHVALFETLLDACDVAHEHVAAARVLADDGLGELAHGAVVARRLDADLGPLAPPPISPAGMLRLVAPSSVRRPLRG